MKRREFIVSGGAALLLLHSPVSIFGNARRKTPANVLLIKLATSGQSSPVSLSGKENLITPGIDRLMESGTGFEESLSAQAGIPDLLKIMQDSRYRKFHVGHRDLPAKADRKHFTVLHEGGWCGELSDQDVTSGARSFLRKYTEADPFFLSVAYLSPEESSLSGEENFPRSLERIDLEIDLLLHELERSHWKENTTVLYALDHGSDVPE